MKKTFTSISIILLLLVTFWADAQSSSTFLSGYTSVGGLAVQDDTLYFYADGNFYSVDLTTTSPSPSLLTSSAYNGAYLEMVNDELYFSSFGGGVLGKINVISENPDVEIVLQGGNSVYLKGFEIVDGDIYMTFGSWGVSKIDLSVDPVELSSYLSTGGFSISDIVYVNGSFFLPDAMESKVFYAEYSASIPNSSTFYSQDYTNPISIHFANGYLYAVSNSGTLYQCEPGDSSTFSTILSFTTNYDSNYQITNYGSDLFISGGSDGNIYRITDLDTNLVVTENELIDLQVYPNPTTDYIKIDGVEESLEFVVYNTSGKLVLEGCYSRGETIDVSTLNSGVYYLKTAMGNTQILKK